METSASKRQGLRRILAVLLGLGSLGDNACMANGAQAAGVQAAQTPQGAIRSNPPPTNLVTNPGPTAAQRQLNAAWTLFDQKKTGTVYEGITRADAPAGFVPPTLNNPNWIPGET